MTTGEFVDAGVSLLKESLTEPNPEFETKMFGNALYILAIAGGYLAFFLWASDDSIDRKEIRDSVLWIVGGLSILMAVTIILEATWERYSN